MKALAVVVLLSPPLYFVNIAIQNICVLPFDISTLHNSNCLIKNQTEWLFAGFRQNKRIALGPIIFENYFLCQDRRGAERGEERREERRGEERRGEDFNQGNIDNELAQNCKHKEIIKGANVEGNEIKQVGHVNQ